LTKAPLTSSAHQGCVERSPDVGQKGAAVNEREELGVADAKDRAPDPAAAAAIPGEEGATAAALV